MRSSRHHDGHARASDRYLDRITGSKRRARSAREKVVIVAEAFAPEANISKIRRHHGLNRGLLFSWQRQVRRVLSGLAPLPLADGTWSGIGPPLTKRGRRRCGAWTVARRPSQSAPSAPPRAIAGSAAE